MNGALCSAKARPSRIRLLGSDPIHVTTSFGSVQVVKAGPRHPSGEQRGRIAAVGHHPSLQLSYDASERFIREQWGLGFDVLYAPGQEEKVAEVVRRLIETGNAVEV